MMAFFRHRELMGLRNPERCGMIGKKRKFKNEFESKSRKELRLFLQDIEFYLQQHNKSINKYFFFLIHNYHNHHHHQCHIFTAEGGQRPPPAGAPFHTRNRGCRDLYINPKFVSGNILYDLLPDFSLLCRIFIMEKNSQIYLHK